MVVPPNPCSTKKSVATPISASLLRCVSRALGRPRAVGHELARRRQAWTMPPYKATRGVLAKYIRTVRTASEGCVTDE